MYPIFIQIVSNYDDDELVYDNFRLMNYFQNHFSSFRNFKHRFVLNKTNFAFLPEHQIAIQKLTTFSIYIMFHLNMQKKN